MGVGKSTIGKKLAQRLKRKFVDVDKIIEIKEKNTIKEIFENKGENYFRKIEDEMTLTELRRESSVISLGGGAFLNNVIRKNAKKLSVSFWLDVPIEELIKRLRKSKQRPLLHKQKTSEVVKKIYFERNKIYNTADFRIKCKSFKSEEIANRILNLYEKSGS